MQRETAHQHRSDNVLSLEDRRYDKIAYYGSILQMSPVRDRRDDHNDIQARENINILTKR